MRSATSYAVLALFAGISHCFAGSINLENRVAYMLPGMAVSGLNAVCIKAAPQKATIMNNETTVEWVHATYPERISGLFKQLDLDRKGLEAVKEAVEGNDHVAACRALLAYYRTGPSGAWLRWTELPVPNVTRDARGDAILEDTFTFYSQTDPVPRRPDGGLNWNHRGPSGDWEWTLALNRHHHLSHLLDAYRKTGHQAYAARIDAHLRDWICFSLPYPARKNVGDLWRGLEISFRAKAWAAIFHALQHDDSLSPAARLLLLTSLPEHAHHLRHFHGDRNWLTMELSALGMIAAAWPEFKESTAWLEYASATLTRELSTQIYPDGVQDELTSHYHRVALSNFEQFAEICRGAGIPMPDAYAAGLENMWHYLAAAMRPSGHGPLNNDSDLDYNRDRVLAAAKTYGRPDWTYIASNGTEGKRPPYGPSVFFPWAGQLVIRSGWNVEALWAFFDIGPWGTSHQHNDMLHLSLSAYGRDLLVDSGRFVYSGRNRRFLFDYARHSRAHNVVVIDGSDQRPGPRRTTRPITGNDYHIAPEMTFARGVCDHFETDGHAMHTRVVLYLAPHLIVVADRIETDRPRQLEALWHWHPDCTVTIDHGTILSTDADVGNLRIVPVAGFEWNINRVQGQEVPHLQGWYSPRYNVWEPNPTAVLTADIAGTTAFVWLLHTARGDVGGIGGEILENTDDAIGARIFMPDKQDQLLTIPWRKGKPLMELRSRVE